MKLIIKRDADSKLLQVFVRDTSTEHGGGGLTGLAYNTGSLTAYYYREGAASAVAISLADMTVGTWVSGGFKEIDATNMPGWYQLGLPDAAIADDAESVGVTLKGAANMAPVNLELQLDLADVIWDEVLTGNTHNVPTSAGRRLRGIQEFQGYELGSIWIDTVNGVAGTTDYENGTVERPVRSLTDALALATSLNIKRFQLTPDSVLTLDAPVDGKLFSGVNWTLALGGQSCSDTAFLGASVSGICTGANPPRFWDCEMGACTLPPCRLHSCGLNDDLTLSGAGDYHLDQCYSDVAGAATPSVDFGAVGSTNLNMRHYSGGIEIENMGDVGTDVMSLEGSGQLIINANCSGGTIAIRGAFTVTDNASGVVTLSDDARYDTDQINATEIIAIKAKTDNLPADPADASDIAASFAALNDLSAAQVNAEVVDVIRTDTVAEIAAVPAANASLHAMIQWLFSLVRNKRTTTESSDTLRNDADDADVAEATLSHTATTFTKGKYE